jgi:tetratricopeptide (TPR) repeat protein
VAKAELFDTLGDFYRGFGHFDEAEPLLQQALELRREHLGTDHADYAASLHSLAWLYHDQGRYTRAEELYREALAIRLRVLGPGPLVDATRFNLAWLMTLLGDYEQAEDLFQQVLAARLQRDGEDNREVAVVKGAIAALYLDRGQDVKALPWIAQSIATFRHLDGDRGLVHAVGLFQQGVFAVGMKQYGVAEARLKEALAIIKETLGERHPYNALVLYELAHTLEEKGDDAGAEANYRRCLDVGRASVGFGHPKAVVGVTALALLLGRTKRAAEADALFEEVLKAHRARFGAEHFLVADALVAQAGVLAARGDRAGQGRVLAEAYAIYRKAGNPRARMYATCLNNLAVVHSRDKKYPEAERLLEEALPLGRRQYGEADPRVAQVLVNLSSAKLSQAKTDGVEEMLRQAEKVIKPPLPFAAPPPLLDDLLAQRGDLYRRTGRLKEAEDTALHRRRLWPNDPDTLFESACDLAQLVPLSGEPADRDRRAALATETLRQAKGKGFKDVRLLETAATLAALRGRNDFQQLLRELRGKP